MNDGKINIPWHRFPLLRVVIALILGIGFSTVVTAPATLYLSLAITGGLLTVSCHLLGVNIANQLFVKSTLLLVTTFFIGAARYSAETYSLPETHYSHHLHSASNQTIEVIILERPKVRNRARTFVDVTAVVDSTGTFHSVVGKMVLYFLADDSIATRYEPGDKVALSTTVSPTLSNTNPYAFDYKEYLHNRGIDYQAFVAADRHTRVAAKELAIWAQVASDLRGHALRTINTFMKGDNEKAVVSAMLLGYRNNISSELYQSYTDTGVVHVLAVSGLHVGIVAGLLLYLLSFLPDQHTTTKLIKSSIVIIVLAAYVLITGAAPAVVRAAVMFGLMLLASFLKDDLNVFNSLSLAALLMLLVAPSMLYQASFQFSFLALTSIVFFQPYLAQLFTPKSRILDWTWQMVTVSIAAQVLVFPLTIYYFHKFPVYFMLSSIVAIPAAVGIIYGGIAMVLAAFVLPSAMTALIGTALSYWVGGFNRIIDLINALPGTVVKGLWFEPSTTILLYVLIGLLMLYLAFDRKYQIMMTGLYVVLLMVTLSGLRGIGHHHQAFLTVYDIYGGYAVDFILGRETISLQDTSISGEKHHFAVYNNRIRHQANSIMQLDDGLSTEKLAFDPANGYLLAGNKKILISSGMIPTECTAVDLLLITKADQINPTTYLRTIDPELIVVDSSIDWKYRRRWEAAANDYGHTLYRVDQSGAFTYSLRS